MESPVDDPMQTIESFNRQFNLNQLQKEAVVEWILPQEVGDKMFALVIAYAGYHSLKVCRLRIFFNCNWLAGIYWGCSIITKFAESLKPQDSR